MQACMVGFALVRRLKARTILLATEERMRGPAFLILRLFLNVRSTDRFNINDHMKNSNTLPRLEHVWKKLHASKWATQEDMQTAVLLDFDMLTLCRSMAHRVIAV